MESVPPMQGGGMELSMTDNESRIEELLSASPIIAAVKNDEGLEKALNSDCDALFLLYGTILNIGELTDRVKNKNKAVFVHIDLVEGLAGKEISVDFIKQTTKADGILSTRLNILKRSKELGLISIQRLFLFDSLSIQNVQKQSVFADAIDILPGIMPKITEEICQQTTKPVIVSGLILEKQDIISALSAGAVGISTTSEYLWDV